MSSNVTKIAAGAAAVVAIGVGAAAVGSASTGGDSQQAGGFGGPAAQQGPPGSQQGQQGQAGAGAGAVPPGMGTAVTGAAAEKVEKAALAKYPGTIERIEQLPDGSYVAHVIQSNGEGEIHVLVDEEFNVTGQQARPSGPPPGGMMPPGANGAQPPSSGSGSGSAATN